MKAVPRDKEVEVAAAALASYAGDAFSDVNSVTGRPTCTAKWPKDWSRREQAGFRVAARAMLDAVAQINQSE